MKHNIFISITIITAYTINLHAQLPLNEEFSNIGKNLYTQAGFYSTCGNKKIITKKTNVIKWTQFRASQYVSLAKQFKPMDKKIKKLLNESNNFKDDMLDEVKKHYPLDSLEDIHKKWFISGTKGIVVSDPKISDETFNLKFTKKNCNIVKKILDTNYDIMYNIVFK